MEEDFIRIGRISKNVIKKFSLVLSQGEEVFILSKTLDEFASRWPASYLIKIIECKNILKTPLYGAYSENKRALYLVKEYVQGDSFKKVTIEIDLKKQPHLVGLYTLTSEKSSSIVDQKTRWILLSR